MYGGKGGGMGAGSIANGAIILPNTGGHLILTIVALTSIAVGTAILLSTFLRWMTQRSYNQQ